MKLTFDSQDQGKEFGLTMQIRNAKGKPTGKTKTIHTNNSFQVWQFYQRYKSNLKRKKKKTNEKLPEGKDADKLAQKIAEETELKQGN